MFPSPFNHNFSDPNKINRITVTVQGPKGSGKSNLANFILAGLRAQQFQAGITDPAPDTFGNGPRYHQNTIVGIEVTETGGPSLVELQKQLATETAKSEELYKQLQASKSELTATQAAMKALTDAALRAAPAPAKKDAEQGPVTASPEK